MKGMDSLDSEYLAVLLGCGQLPEAAGRNLKRSARKIMEWRGLGGQRNGQRNLLDVHVVPLFHSMSTYGKVSE